jgi:hypothetical protein
VESSKAGNNPESGKMQACVNIRGVLHGEARLGGDGLPYGHGDWEVPMPPSRAKIYLAVFLFSFVSACSHSFYFRLL